MNKCLRLVLAALLFAVSPVGLYAADAQAADGLKLNVNTKRLYVGGGLLFNSLPGAGSARGFQFIAGYTLNALLNDDITTAVELGYANSGKFYPYGAGGKTDSAAGLWAAVVESVPLTRKSGMLARLGYDFGDDDGFLAGAGLYYRFNTRIKLRSEYVARQHYNGLQFNLLVGF